MKELIKQFALDNLISEKIAKMLIKASFEQAAVKGFPENDHISFNVEKLIFYFIKDGIVKEKKLNDLGREFILPYKQELAYLLNQTYPEKFKYTEPIKKQKKYNFDGSDHYDDGPYCSACQQAPCMCSDREKTSTVYDF